MSRETAEEKQHTVEEKSKERGDQKRKNEVHTPQKVTEGVGICYGDCCWVSNYFCVGADLFEVYDKVGGNRRDVLRERNLEILCEYNFVLCLIGAFSCMSIIIIVYIACINLFSIIIQNPSFQNHILL